MHYGSHRCGKIMKPLHSGERKNSSRQRMDKKNNVKGSRVLVRACASTVAGSQFGTHYTSFIRMENQLMWKFKLKKIPIPWGFSQRIPRYNNNRKCCYIWTDKAHSQYEWVYLCAIMKIRFNRRARRAGQRLIRKSIKNREFHSFGSNKKWRENWEEKWSGQVAKVEGAKRLNSFLFYFLMLMKKLKSTGIFNVAQKSNWIGK